MRRSIRGFTPRAHRVEINFSQAGRHSVAGHAYNLGAKAMSRALCFSRDSAGSLDLPPRPRFSKSIAPKYAGGGASQRLVNAKAGFREWLKKGTIPLNSPRMARGGRPTDWTDRSDQVTAARESARGGRARIGDVRSDRGLSRCPRQCPIGGTAWRTRPGSESAGRAALLPVDLSIR